MLEPFQLPFVQRGIVEVAVLAVGRRAARHLDRPARAGLLLPRGRAPRPSPGSCSPTGSASPPCSAPAPPPRWSPSPSALLARREGARDRYDTLTALVLVGRAGGRRDPRQRRLPLRRGNVETLLFGSLLLVDARRLRLRRRQRASLVLAGGLRARAALAGDRLRPGARRAPSAPARRCPTSSLLALVALVAVAALSALGALLATALLVVPAATTRLVCSRLRPWQLATRRARRASRASSGCGCRSSSTRRPGRRSPCSPAAVFARRRRAAARSAPRRAGRAPRRPRRRRSRCSPAAATRLGERRRPGQAEVVATTTQIGDFARAVGGDAADVIQILQPNTDPHDYEPRPARRARRPPAPTSCSLNGDEPRRLDGRGRRGRPAATRRSSTSARTSRSRSPGESTGPRRRATTRTGGTTRATPRPRSARSATR